MILVPHPSPTKSPSKSHQVPLYANEPFKRTRSSETTKSESKCVVFVGECGDWPAIIHRTHTPTHRHTHWVHLYPFFTSIRVDQGPQESLPAGVVIGVVPKDAGRDSSSAIDTLSSFFVFSFLQDNSTSTADRCQISLLISIYFKWIESSVSRFFLKNSFYWILNWIEFKLIEYS